MRGTTRRRIGRKLGSLFLCFAMLLSLVVLPVQAATVDGTYAPGTYTGEALGHDNGKVTVTVTLDKNDEGTVVISKITADGSTQTSKFWAKAETLLATIKAKNGTDGVDTVSGATKSSNAILNATEIALAKANPSFSGSGTECDPYVIQTADQLAAFAAAVDNGNAYEGKYVVLGDDIDLSGIKDWNPIGAEGSNGTFFRGTFDGRDYTISGLTIAANVTSGESNHGLFSTLGNQAVVKNLHVTNANIVVTNSGDKIRAGVIAGGTEKTATSGHANIGTRIDSCSATGTVSATSANDKLTYAGGIAGTGDIGTAITNCWTDVTVTATIDPKGTKNSMAGGIIGNSGNYAVIANCATFGDVHAVSTIASNYGGMAGGIVGMMAGKQYNTYATGDITVGNGGITKHSWVGALDGQVTSSGMTKDSSGNYTSYPAEGPFRQYNYYATNATLKVEVYKNNGAELDTTTKLDTTVDRGSSSTLGSLDKAMVSTEMTKETMADKDFAEALNGKIKEINGILTAYGITGVALREWQLEDGRILPTGDVWSSGEIDGSIFASGDGSGETPYLITDEAQLRAFAASLTEKIDYTGKYVALEEDISVSSAAWTPIGGSDYLFNGTFDGRGHTISGLTLGSAETAFALDKENLYIGLFGVLGPKSVVKNVNLANVAFYTSYEATAYVGGIAGVTQGSTTKNDYTGAVIDGCSVAGTLVLSSAKGNQFVGGLVGMQYKGATINSSAKVDASGVVTAGDLAEVGGLVGLNNRGLIANCWSDSTIYGSGSRENGNEGMAVVSSLVACNAGALVNCYGSGDVTTKEHSTYAGMVSGWVTGIGKSYACWYDLDSTMIVGADTKDPLVVKPVESIGTKVASGVNDEGDAYTGGLVDRMTGYDTAGYAAIAGFLNETFTAFPIDITVFGLGGTALKTWIYDEDAKLVTFGDTNGTVTYLQPDCEKVTKPEQKMLDGTWFGRDDGKTTVVKLIVTDGAVVSAETLSGESAGEAYDAAVEKAEYKATYGDFSHYEKADPSRFAGGSGTQADPYLIANETQLRYLSSSINADVSWKGVWFKQTADITLNGQWQPIGWALNGEVNGKKTAIAAYPFRGSYDGGGFTISGLTIGTKDAPTDQMASGLFGLTSGSYSSNEKPSGDEQVVRLTGIHLRDVSIHVSTRYETFTGGLVGSGQNGIYIDDCSVTGTIASTTSESFARAGGLAASVLRGAVTNSWADVDITAVTDTNHVYAGGLYGMDNRVTTVNCYALGDVTGSSSNNNKVHIGGFVGQAGGIHVNCYAAGDVVSLKSTTDVGIFSGRATGIDIDYHCYYDTKATLHQGDTVITPAKAVGVVTTNATEVDVTGKTTAELRNSDFAALLNANRAALSTAMDAIDQLLSEPASGLVQANYYEGNDLASWTAGSGIVTFGTDVRPSGGGGGGGGTTTPTTPTTPTEPSGLPFVDVKSGDWSYDSVRYVYEKGMMTGTAADRFSSDAVVTRAMLVTILHRLEGTPTAAASGFADVPAGQWYTEAVAWAAANGIVNGTDATTFAPDDPLTREQFAAILYRYATYKGMDNVTLAEVLGQFTDGDTCSAYAVPALEWAVHQGLIHGVTDTTLAPKSSATRAQAAAILARFCESGILK